MFSRLHCVTWWKCCLHSIYVNSEESDTTTQLQHRIEQPHLPQVEDVKTKSVWHERPTDDWWNIHCEACRVCKRRSPRTHSWRRGGINVKLHSHYARCRTLTRVNVCCRAYKTQKSSRAQIVRHTASVWTQYDADRRKMWIATTNHTEPPYHVGRYIFII